MADITLSSKNSGGLMKRLTTISLYAAILLILGTAPTFALTFSGQAPQTGSTQGDTNTAFNNMLTQLNGASGQFKNIDRPTKMTAAYADAATFSNSAATQRGYINYDMLSLSLGIMAGAQLPGSGRDDLKNLGDDLEENGDAKVGANVQFAGQVGLNCSALVDGLYLGIKYGSIKYDYNEDDNKYEFDAFIFGLVANYELMKGSEIGLGFIKWRGLSFGSGLVYQRTKNNFFLDGNTVTTNSGSVALSVNPDLEFALKTTTLSVPLELTTAFRLFWCLNLHAGVGADLQLIGKSEMKLGTHAGIGVTGATVNRPGYISASEKVKEDAGIFQPKLMLGIGIGIADYLVLEMPITYYLDDGVNVGITLGCYL